ncbi:hypothetical protein WDW86_01645 [Bdellovibrionota bacterium FG-2]
MRSRTILTSCVSACFILTLGLVGCNSDSTNDAAPPSPPAQTEATTQPSESNTQPTLEIPQNPEIVVAPSFIDPPIHNEPIPPAPVPTPTVDRSWSFSLQNPCTDTPLDQCVGAYKFSISSSGAYSMGPTPEGKTKTGKIGENELKLLQAGLAKTLEEMEKQNSTTERCLSFEDARMAELDPTLPNDTLALTACGKTLTVLRSQQEEVCFNTPSPITAAQLHQSLRALAERYYALPFPNLCQDSVDAAQALYPQLVGCSTDADCSYINNAFDPIPSYNLQYVIVDNCSLVTPLAVGNARYVAAAQSKLQLALDQAQAVCGDSIIRNSCLGLTGFQSSEAPPVCDQGVCKINPSIRY